jgi:hypothetical protein
VEEVAIQRELGQPFQWVCRNGVSEFESSQPSQLRYPIAQGGFSESFVWQHWDKLIFIAAIRDPLSTPQFLPALD